MAKTNDVVYVNTNKFHTISQQLIRALYPARQWSLAKFHWLILLILEDKVVLLPIC